MNRSIETMDKPMSSNIETKPEIKFTPEVLSWLNFIEEISLFSPHNIEAIAKSAEEAKREGVPLPFIINLCPAIENLKQPTERGQTRKLLPLSKDNPRLIKFVQELASFMVTTKDMLGVTPEIFLIFSDVLEPGSEKMFVNSDEIEAITNQSLKTIRKLFFQIDRANPGLFQEKKIRIPKIHQQSRVLELAGKIGINPHNLIAKVEFEELDPNSPAHEAFERHLKLTRNDPSFVPTGWQSHTGRIAIHNRVRFMVAQCWTDGVILPKLMRHLLQKRFPEKMPSPIFVISTTREAGAILQKKDLTFALNNPKF